MRIDLPVVTDLQLPVEIECARDVTRNGIERLGVSPVTLGRARIDQPPTRIASHALDERRIDRRPLPDGARIRPKAREG